MIEPGILGLTLFFVATGALVKGMTGFGFGILGTALLVNFVPADEAVTLMIFPLLAVNIPLILEADASVLKTCLRNYKFFIFTGLASALIGVLVVDLLPVNILSLSVGFLALLYVYGKQDVFYRPKTSLSGLLGKDWKTQSLAGSIAGVVFGASNVGLLYVTYLKEIEVDQRTFAGLLSIIILGGTLLRASVSAVSGLYNIELLQVSVMAGLLGLAVSEFGARISHRLPDKISRDLTLFLILLVGLRIIWVSTVF